MALRRSSKLSAESNPTQAEHVLKRALEKAMLVLPLTDTDVLVTRLNLGALKQRLGRTDEALWDFEARMPCHGS